MAKLAASSAGLYTYCTPEVTFEGSCSVEPQPSAKELREQAKAIEKQARQIKAQRKAEKARAEARAAARAAIRTSLLAIVQSPSNRYGAHERIAAAETLSTLGFI